ncbi:MAG: branched-chain amino acid ABC transporter permease [Xanthobacteraceae bacterium]
MTAIIIQLLIGGLLLGGLYALIAFGLSLIYGVARILNFAHGTLLVVAGIAASVMFAAWQLNPVLIAALLSLAFFAFGWLMYVLLLEPLKARTPVQTVVGTVLVTVGLLLVLSDMAAQLVGPTNRNIRLDVNVFAVGGIIVSTTELYVLLGIVISTVALHLILTRTWFGGAVRAVTQDSVGARLCGVRAGTIHAATVAFGSAIVAVAGVLYTLNFPVNPYVGFELTVKAFTIIILGGIGSLPGALLAGIFLGVAEALTGFFWSSDWAPGLSIMLLLAILIVFPQGFLSRRAT